MKKQIIILKMILIFFIVPLNPTFAQEAPSEVIQAAEQGLQSFLEQIPKNKLEDFGFSQNDILSQAYLDEPYQLYAITPSVMDKYQEGDPVDSIISATSMWYFPVMYNNDIKTILIVDKMDDRWKAVSLGNSILANELGKVRKRWSKADGYNPYLITVFQPRMFLFHISGIDAYNVTPIKVPQNRFRKSGRVAKKDESQNKGLDYNTLDTLSNIVGTLKKSK